MKSRTPLPRAAARDAFTLIEILVVIAIIAILAGLLLSTAGFVQEKAGNERAKVELAGLENALEAYKLDNGAYPDGDGSDNSTKDLLDALNRTPAKQSPPGKIYFEVPGKMLPSTGGSSSYNDKLTAAKYLQDPFGNPYHYQFPGKDDRSGTNFFDLWSQGKKNDPTATNKWIKSW
ncbi:MAG: type II secretion system protein GspG [Terrimicrobiaceae bacterium]|nr:type II secretion system protein GspG [Terrimicrobiaceae bacterium]